MQTTGDRNQGNAAGPTSTNPASAEQSRQNGPAADAATEIARHYGDHGHPATSSAGPSPEAANHQSEPVRSAVSGAAGAARDAANRTAGQASSAVAKAGETAQDLANRAGEQVRSAASGATEAARNAANRAAGQAAPAIGKVTGVAQDLANRAREQAGPAAQAVYDQGTRAGEYVTRNVHQYPATALLIAAAVGYGLAYLVHGSSRRGAGD